MAGPDTALLGIGYALDPDIVHDDEGKPRRYPPWSKRPSLADDLYDACSPLISPATPRDTVSGSLSPNSLVQAVSSDPLLHANTALGGSNIADDVSSSRDPGDIFLPLDRFAKTYQRHEQIALFLAGPNTQCERPYRDYVPCPGSGPGSPAISVATDCIRPPPRDMVDALQAELQLITKPEDFIDVPPPVSTASPLTRYVSDTAQIHEWLAVVMQQSAGAGAPHDPVSAPTPDPAPSRHEPHTSAITLDGDVEEIPSSSHLAAPDNAGALSTIRKHGYEEEADGPSETFQVLADISRAKRAERITASGQPRWRRPIRMRHCDSPPHKKTKTDE